MQLQRKSLFLLALILACPTLVLAGQSAIPAAFADIGLGARAMGLGGANSVGDGRVMDLFWNPAGLVSLERSEISMMQTEQFGLVPTYLLAGARPRMGKTALAVGMISSGDALLRENTLLLGAGRKTPFLAGLDLGAVLKFRHASFGSGGTADGVQGSAWGFGLDLGLHGRRGPVIMGLVYEEAISNMRWSSSTSGKYDEAIPPTLTGGIQFRSGPLIFCSDLELGLKQERASKVAVGLEWIPHSVLQLRGGMKQRLDADAMRFFTLGAGVGHNLESGQRLQLDSAYLFHELGSSLRISMGYRFQ
jgi:hypothetical protein